MDEKLSAILDGTVGWFWPGFEGPKPIDSEFERGYLRLIEPDTIELAALDEDVFHVEGKQGAPWPLLITGSTELDTVLILDFKGFGQKIRMGGAASVRRYRARTILSNVPIKKIRSERLKSISAHFFGVSRWFGVSSATESFGHTAEGRLQSFSVTVKSEPERVVALTGGRELVVSGHWYARGSSDRRTIHSPVEISCRSSGAPKSLWNCVSQF